MKIVLKKATETEDSVLSLSEDCPKVGDQGSKGQEHEGGIDK